MAQVYATGGIIARTFGKVVMPNLSITCEITCELRQADYTLTEYGRWATRASGGAGFCGSAERGFRRQIDRRESIESFLDRRVPRNPLMATQDALRCQRALAQLPDRERIVLSVLYVPRRLPPEAQLRIMRIPPSLSVLRHKAGLRMFVNMYRMLGTRHLDSLKPS
jgi:hypothetical protein